MFKKVLHHIIILPTLMMGAVGAQAQTDSTTANTLEGLSLKDLLNIKIVSVSKASEALFEAPLSASVITTEDIQRNGCTSIMEALRLVPGMIVREQSNGNYDIHLRGMDNVPPNASFDVTSNTTTLVMIDSRPIYSYLRGGTFWETLPVTIHDVDKIEVVRGPAAALYGPNAVNGVINIITRQNAKQGFNFNASSRTGSLQTIINNMAAGYRWNKFSVLASGNFQHRQRSQTSYFEYYRNQYLNDPDYMMTFMGDTIRNINERFPDHRVAMEKYAGNIFAAYDLSEKIKFNVSTGLQHSAAQRVSTENELTPLSLAHSDSRYADFRANIHGLTAQVSYNTGTQTTDEAPGNKYDFNTFDANIEYNYTRRHFSIKPGVSYRTAVYDDTRYSDVAHKKGIFNARGQIIRQSAFVRAEYKLLHNKLRLVGGLSASRFNYPDSTYLSYQLAATYKLSKKHLFRAVYSEAPRSSNIFDTYVDQSIISYPVGPKKSVSYLLRGNKHLQLLTANMIEVGYRGHIARRLNIDVELFNIRSNNSSNLVQQALYPTLVGTDTVLVGALVPTNLPMKLKQQGVTVSLTWNARQLKVKPFVTLQYTEIKNYAAASAMPDVNSANHIYSAMGSVMELESTPRLFGGGTIEYTPQPKLIMSLSGYYFTSQTYYHLSNIVINDGVRGIDHIPGKFILNTNISYEPVKGIQLFFSGKNLLNNKSREFFRTDEVPVMFLGGIHYQL